MPKIVKLSFLVLSVSLLSACATYRVGDFTLLSTKNVNLNSGKLALGERVRGEDSSSNVVYFKNAADKAMEKNRCTVALSDAVISLQQGFFTAKYIVEGTQVLDRSLPGCNK